MFEPAAHPANAEHSHTVAPTAGVPPSKPTSKPTTVQEYVDSVPASSRERFDELRAIVTALLPEAAEVLSYGIIGYKPDPGKGARVFISGWADHVAMYPVPQEVDWIADLKPFRRGKGTLWFPLDSPLPDELIRRVTLALVSRGAGTGH